MNSIFFWLLSDNDDFVRAISEQFKLWPAIPNFDIKYLMTSLTALLLRIRKGATKVILIIAEIAEQNTWCHNLLESILQEVFTLVHDNRACPILSDVLEQSSQDLLISTCVTKPQIKQQTAIRLILLASSQSTHIYHHSLTELLSYPNQPENNYVIEALIRLISGANFSNESIGLKPGITIALERLLIDEFKMDDDGIERNLNVLQNLLSLIQTYRSYVYNNCLYLLNASDLNLMVLFSIFFLCANSLEKQGSPIHLKESLLTKTLLNCDATLMEIAKRYLTKAIEYVSFINASELMSFKTEDDEPVSKKIKLIESRLNRKERYHKYTMIYKRHIHAVMNLVDILEIGRKDQPLAMDKCIKWTELIVKYFFWSLTETGGLKR